MVNSFKIYAVVVTVVTELQRRIILNRLLTIDFSPFTVLLKKFQIPSLPYDNLIFKECR